MDEDFIRSRISALRLKKGVSEYRMSTDLGHSKSYVQSISSGRSLPSLSEFLYICEYFGITPREFFDDGLKNPVLFEETVKGLKTLNENDLALILRNIRRLQEK